ncbi:MAG TPA: hypothetical protein VMB75_01880 [Rhodocyclaceae bacterium]|nr:hypothetical protein [Rhodocyclaceae bacterium]
MKATILMLALAVLLAACSEKTQTIGDYRGKVDEKPYDAKFGGDKVKWEAQLRARALNQNEYRRMP